MDSVATAEKVQMAFMLMAVAGRERISQETIALDVTHQMSEAIAALLNDESGAVRQQTLDRLERLWAMYEEHNPLGNPWEIGAQAHE